MEELGGPVWHASVQAPTREMALERIEHELRDVGDASLGEWLEDGTRPTLVHLKRRISAPEAEIVGGIRDLRGTPELKRRMRELLRAAPHLRPHVTRGLQDGLL